LVIGSAAALLTASSPASATGLIHTPVITAAGSDTTEAFMDVVLNGTNEYNIHAQPSSPYTVPGDANCDQNGATAGFGSITYNVTANRVDPQIVAPNGSGAGRDALKSSINGKLANGSGSQTTFPDTTQFDGPLLASSDTACVDIARSSDDPRADTSDATSFDYYAFALDDVTVASPSKHAPASLSIQEIRDIFLCVKTDWSQVGGGADSGPIQRYMPSDSSGTGSTFIRKVLGGDSPRNHVTAQCPAVKTMQENHGDSFIIPTGTQTPTSENSAAVDVDKAIMAYSGGKWAFQANNYFNPSLDLRGGVRILGQIPTGGSAPGLFPVAFNATAGKFRLDASSTMVNEANTNLFTPTNTTGHLSGVRYLYNVLDSNIGTTSYTVARDIAGFLPSASPSATPGGICSGSYLSTIVNEGFLPLVSQTDSTSLTAVSCRKNPVARALGTSISAKVGATALTSTDPTNPSSASRAAGSIVYTITFTSPLNSALVAGNITRSGGSGSCVLADDHLNAPPVATNTRWTYTCTPTTNGAENISIAFGAVNATIGSFPNVPNNFGQSPFITSVA
jgi:ABC-type phosphate transport system substrate-binding protein